MLKKSLLALALGTFALGISQFTMMAILNDVARALEVDVATAGDFISAYSIGVAVGAPFLLFLNRFSLKYVLLFLCVAICFGNAISTCATGYSSLLTGRFISGLPHGAYFGVAAVMATRLASAESKASAVAVMVSGMTVANIFGVPLATWLADAFSWRLAFGMAEGAAALAFLGILFNIAHKPPIGDKGKGAIKSQFMFLKTLPPWLIFIGAFLGQAAIFSWYSYVEPILLHVSHFSRHSLALIMMLAGVGMFVGGVAAGKMADRFKAGLVTAVICALMIPLLLLIYFGSNSQLLSLCLVFFGAALIFALLGPVQYLIVRFAKGGQLLGGAGLQIALNVAGAFAAYLGGCLIHAGAAYNALALAGIPLAMAAAAVMFYFHHRYSD